MQQSSNPIELPQFSKLSTFVLRLVQAYTSWQSPGSGENIFSYFSEAQRHTGDEHSLRATLIRQHILPAFNYLPVQIEYESKERFDLTLWNQDQLNKSRIAIIETKSSSVRNLTHSRQGHETPVQQLRRYLTQAGLYLGVLTNGDEWHLFDFAVGQEPLASFSLVELARFLQGVSTTEAIEQKLNSRPQLQQALTITFYYLDAQRWAQTESFRQRIANQDYFHLASLQQAEHVETLVREIKQVLGSLRETIRSQFGLIQEHFDEYQKLRLITSDKDNRPFQEALQAAIKKVVQFNTLSRLDESGELTNAINALLQELADQFFVSGDISDFESQYLQRAATLLDEHQLSQSSLTDKKTKHSIMLLPPTEGLHELKALLQTHYAYLQSLDEDYALSKTSMEAYNAWKASVRGVFANPQDEFCLQTAYIHFVRLFFVRVCEDHALIPRRISDGPFARYEQYRTELLTGIKDTYLRLLDETYQRAYSVYHNFFGHQKFYDWFTLDEYTILALFTLLNHFDFYGLSADVLGRVYNEGYIENKERSEKGQFYTPPQVVSYMLDALGIPHPDRSDEQKMRNFLEKTVGDLSCGSGTFLVTAATRKSIFLQRLVARQEIDPDHALAILTNTFLGFDLNPFACYLAEINLLIQCLPFLTDEQGRLCRSVDRFHIYCTDALEPTTAEQTDALFNHKATERLVIRPSHIKGQAITDEERRVISIKDAKGLPFELTHFTTDQQGIDYLIGNPPYVSANESSTNLRYREKIWNSGIYQYLHQKWDLFVPFFERNLQFLRPDTGRLALIVSNGIETEGYAEYLRRALGTRYTLLQIDFFPGLRLFQDAAVENTIVLVENGPPDEKHEVIRRRHFQPDCQHFETLPVVTQITSNGYLFRWRFNPLLERSFSEGTIPLCSLVYIGTGLEAQSDEDTDPEVDGKRQKRFTLNDVFLPPSEITRPPDYIDDGVLGDDVDRYYLRRKRFVAYEKYRPQMRGPRHIALFRTPEKLLLGETSGGYYDRSGLFANHSVQVVVPWKALEQAGAMGEKGIQTVWRKSQQLAEKTVNFISLSELFDLRYLLGIINSRFMRQYIASNLHEGTRQGRIYPDIWKRLPIKIASAEKQQSIARLVDAIQMAYQQLGTLPTPRSLAADPSLHYRDIQGYLAQGILQFTGDIQSHISEKPFLRDGRLILSRQPFAYLESSAPELLRYLEIYLNQLHPEFRGWTWAEARKRIQAPTPLDSIQKFMAAVDDIALKSQQIQALITTTSEEIEGLVEKVYAEPADAELLKSINTKSARPQNGELF